MKLYYSPGACSLVVRIILNELKLAATYESVNLATKKTASGQDFLMINAKGAVPTLVTNEGLVLTENAAILQYLADTYDTAKTLLPPVGDFNRYRVLEALNFVSTELHKSAAGFFNPRWDNETKVRLFKPLLEMKLAFAETMLTDKPYLAGEAYSLADAYLYVTLSWLPHLPVNLKEYPHLSAFYERVGARQAVQNSLEEEQASK